MADDKVAQAEARVLARPDDHEARLVLADALVEAGDARGEYIQLACLLERIEARDPRRPELERKVAALESRHNLAWSRELRRVGPLNAGEPRFGTTPFAFRAGFVEALRGPAGNLLPHLEQAAKVAPICRLALTEVDEAALAALAASPSLGQMRELSLELRGAGGLRELLASPALSGLRELRLKGFVDGAAVAALAAQRDLRLRHLELAGGEGLGAAGLAALLDAGVLSELSSLRLDRQDIGAAGAKLLARLPRLAEIALANDKIGKHGAAALAACAGLGSLRLAACGIGEKGAQAIVAAPALRALHTLVIGQGNGVGGKNLAAVLAACELPALVDLGFPSASLKAEGARAIAASDRLGRVERLDISGNALKYEGARLFAAAEGLTSLRALDISGNGIDAVGMRHLAEGPALATVRDLDLANNKCGTEGGKALARWPGLPRARLLRLFYNWMGVLGVRALLERAEALEELYAHENNYGGEPARMIAKAPPPALRALGLREAETDAVTAIAGGPLRDRLESLTLGAMTLDERCAQALAAMGALGELRVSFVTAEGGAAAILRRRFGPFLSVWGDLGWLSLPGPE
jgi:uncharacterized protein (TIGR02996 family)